MLNFAPFEGTFAGSIALARTDLSGDGVADIIAAAGPVGEPRVAVYSGVDATQIASFYAFDSGYRGGLSVAVGDVNGDGIPDIVVGSLNGWSHVKVFSGRDYSELASFYAFDGFLGGVNVACADMNGDGHSDIVVGTQTGFSHVKVFSGLDGSLLASFFAFDAGYVGGVSVAAGDLNDDGHAEIVVGSLRGASNVKVFNGSDSSELGSFYAYDPAYAGGVNVAVLDVDGNGIADIGTGSRTSSHIKAFHFIGLEEFRSFLAFEDGFIGDMSIA